MEEQKEVNSNRYIQSFLWLGVIIFGLYECSLYNYDLFHILAEIFAIIIGVCAFILVWNTREITSNKYLLFIGITLLFVSIIDFVHTLSYKGMGIFADINEADVATQLWIAARYIQSISFLLTFLFIWGKKSIRTDLIIFIYSTITVLVLTSIFYWHIFPTCFVTGQGLTLFKKASEYIISLILIASTIILYTRKSQIDKNIWRLLSLSFIVTVASEVAFVFYISVFGFSNFVGHIFKIIAFYLLYQAIIVTVLRNPFDTLFVELKKSRDSLEEEKTLTEAAESRAKRERDLAEIYLMSIGSGVEAISKDWKITLWNNAAETITGYTKDEAIGKNFRMIVKIIHEYNRTDNFGFIEESMVLGKTQEITDKTVLIKKDGTEIPIGGKAAPVKDENGEITGVIVIMRDITKERYVATLHSDFAYASHQLRTPINKAMWSLENVLESKDPEKIKSSAKESYQSLKSVHELSEELVSVSEIDQGLVIPINETIKSTALFDDIIKEVGKKARENKINIVVSPTSITTSITTCPKLLKGALVEIVDNAVTYSTRKSEVKVTLTEHNGTLLFAIQDFGIGIDLEHQPLVFTKFFRGSNFDTNKIAGTGLGLYIAKEYVKLLNGKIWFKTDPKKGTTFYVSIPSKM